MTRDSQLRGEGGSLCLRRTHLFQSHAQVASLISTVPIDRVEHAILLCGVRLVDLVRERQQAGHVALHADTRSKASVPNVGCSANLGTGQRIEMSLEIIAEGPS
jgi:hypothetical protein